MFASVLFGVSVCSSHRPQVWETATNDCTLTCSCRVGNTAEKRALRVEMDSRRCFLRFSRLPSVSVIPQHIIDSVMASIDLPDYIGETVPLAHRAGSHEGLCPFHKEATPSFKVFHDHYHCFGCGEHGNALEFAMKLQGLSFPEALRLLASRTGIVIPSSNKPVPTTPDLLAGPKETLRRACAKYQYLLLSEAGREAMSILTERGIDDDAIIRFGIGFAPKSWGTLTHDRAFNENHLISTGLAVPRKEEKKGCYDFFRHRIMFPVRDDNGDVVGFGGRQLDGDGPKYLNTAETELYQKGRLIFGLPQARQAIRLKRAVIVAEGFFDVVTPSQAGIEHIVSTCGTALTEAQAELLLSFAEKVFFCFDGDAAGAKATWRTAEMLVPKACDTHEIRLCRLPDGEDPDSFVRKYGADRFLEVLEESPTLTAYLIGELTRGARLPEARARSLTMATALWRRFSSPGLAIFFRQYLCEALQIFPEEFDRLAGNLLRRDADKRNRSCPCCSNEAAIITAEGGFRIECQTCGMTSPIKPFVDACRAIWNRRERPRMTMATYKINEKAYEKSDQFNS